MAARTVGKLAHVLIGFVGRAGHIGRIDRALRVVLDGQRAVLLRLIDRSGVVALDRLGSSKLGGVDIAELLSPAGPR